MIHNYSGLRAFLSVFFAFAMIGTPCYPASDQEPTLLYVSPQGKDNASGTLEQPLRTIRTALLKTGAIDRNTPVKIILREGTYEQDATLVIDRDNVSILSYEGEKAIISGGKRLSPKQLKKVTAKDAWERIQPQVRERIREIGITAGRCTCFRIRASHPGCLDRSLHQWAGGPIGPLAQRFNRIDRQDQGKRSRLRRPRSAFPCIRIS